jgi:hypothetical protein
MAEEGQQMAGKNGSTQHTAPMAVEETSGGQSRPSQQPLSEDKHHPAHRQDDPEQQSTMQSRPTSQDHMTPRGMLDRSLQAQLGRQLRAIFADIASEPVPERFIKLLEALEAKEERR